jgi:glycosyltransferase involved in cell wall biosynthesis
VSASTQQSALIVQRSSNLDGSAFSGLLLANGLREAGWVTHVAFGFEGPIIERYAAVGHRTHVVPHMNWLRRGRTHQFLKDAWLECQKVQDFEALLDKVKPDVVYVNTVVSLAGAIAARRAGQPCVWHLRELFDDVGGEMSAPNWAIPIVRQVIRRHASRVLANSVATAQNLLGRNIGDVTIVPNAVRSTFFKEDRTCEQARAVFDLSMEHAVIGVPGTLRPMKGHHFFLKSVAPLIREHHGLHVAITGGGESDFTAGVRAEVQALGIQDKVHFLGWVEDMQAFYRACNLACVPSRAEAFGRTIIEAFAVGTPVVATAVGGISEIIDSGETGLLVPYNDGEALASSLSRLLATPDLRQKMSAKARQVAEDKYHESVYKERIVQIVNDVIEA